jgi:ribosomal protein S18 acetylase RimI-like enzyme
MRIRNANVTDAAGIAAIHVRGWQAAYADALPADFLSSISVLERTRRWEERLSSGTVVLIAENDDGEMVGWLSLGDSRDSDADYSVGEVYAIYVDPKHWGEGIGSGLMTEGHSILAAGHVRITLWVIESNARARAFYERRGYTLDPSRDRISERGGVSVRELRYVRPA